MKTTITKYEVYSRAAGAGLFGIYDTLEAAQKVTEGTDWVIIPTEYRVG